MDKPRDYKIFSGFIIKIIAIIAMTFDHIGYFLETLPDVPVFEPLFRVIGRLSFPLFIFLLVEGIRYTKNTAKYFLRLSLLALAFFVGQMFYFYFNRESTLVSPAVDLILTATCVYLLKRKDKFSFLAILPIAWSFVCLFARNYELTNNTTVKWAPFFLRADYTIYGPLLGIAFYYSNILGRMFLNQKEETKVFVDTTYERTTVNLISALFLFVVTIIFTLSDKHCLHVIYYLPWELYATLAFIPILLYSGKRGYNAKWFQYGCYFYFPMHLIIIFLIFALL